MHSRLSRILVALLILFAPFSVMATDYSDIWWNPAESGWGVNLAQSDNFIFATFFVYGPNNQPTWYAGNLNADGKGNYTGALFTTTGPFFGLPFDPAQVGITQAGTATFTPTAADTGTLTYNVGNVNVVKNIQRQTLTSIALGGTYSGGQQGTYSGASCALGAYTDHFDVQVAQPGDGTVTLSFTYSGNLTCTIAGTLQQKGQLYSIPKANYACSTGLNTSASITELKATSLGIEGRLAAPSVGSGCREDATFSAALWNG